MWVTTSWSSRTRSEKNVLYWYQRRLYPAIQWAMRCFCHIQKPCTLVQPSPQTAYWQETLRPASRATAWGLQHAAEPASFPDSSPGEQALLVETGLPQAGTRQKPCLWFIETNVGKIWKQRSAPQQPCAPKSLKMQNWVCCWHTKTSETQRDGNQDSIVDVFCPMPSTGDPGQTIWAHTYLCLSILVWEWMQVLR